jgi:hypothetical protein
VLSMKQLNSEAEPLDDRDEGAWVLEGSAETFGDLQSHLGLDFQLWHEALERSGAVYYSHYTETCIF